jgi:AcrR family transcriptional regulator
MTTTAGGKQPDDPRAAQLGEAGGRAGGKRPDDSRAAQLGEAGRRAGGKRPDDSRAAQLGEAGRRAGGKQPDGSRAAQLGEAGGRAGGKRERTKLQNRAAILAAARGVFAELGYDAAGVRDVIRRTGLASGTFYNYFPDKEAVFRAVLDQSAQEVRRRLISARAGASTLEQFVGDAYLAWFEFLVEDRLMFELMHRNSGTIRAMFGDPILGAGVEELLDDLRAAIGRGDVPPLDADYMAGAMAGVALELGVRMAERQPPDPQGAARFATELFLGGIARFGSAAGPQVARPS